MVTQKIIGIVAAVGIIVGTTVAITVSQREAIIIPSLDFRGTSAPSPLLGSTISIAADGITLTRYTQAEAALGILINADEHNVFSCAGNGTLISSAAQADTVSRFWGYEYSGNEVQNKRNGETGLDLFDGKFFISQGELNASPGQYDSINTLTSVSSNKVYYFMSERDLIFQCGLGMDTIRACGNTFFDPGEQCDDGNTVPGDGCGPTCLLEECGNGVVDPGEQCDDDNTTPGDGCNATCQNEICGNSVIDSGEQCDDGNTLPSDGCSPTCQNESCGDGTQQASEQCDDGNTVPGDGCSATCQDEICGDGFHDPNGPDNVLGNTDDEQCDDGNTVPEDGCSATCRLEICGNSTIDPGEQCDDGNTTPGDGCSAICHTEICGNSTIDPGEQCDDGNTLPNDGCGPTCQNEICGDNIVQASEQCDDGNTTPGDGCSATCQNELTFDQNGLVLWLKARDGAMTAGLPSTNNQLVDTWQDRSPSGLVFSQATSTRRPTYVGSYAPFNNLPALLLQTNDAIASTSALPALTNFTVFLVTTSSANNGYHFEDLGPSGQIFRISRQNSRLQMMLGDGTTILQGSGGTVTTANDVFSVTFDATTKTMQSFNNGNPVTTVTKAGYTVPSFAGGGLPTIGSNTAQNSNFMNGRMGELIIFNRVLTSVEREAVGDYLRDLYASPPSIPCGNGVIDPGEGCDDNNLISGDGCSNVCTEEQNFLCTGQPSMCEFILPGFPCGDGALDANGPDNIAGNIDDEQCDDGNNLDGDGCFANCKLMIPPNPLP